MVAGGVARLVPMLLLLLLPGVPCVEAAQQRRPLPAGHNGGVTERLLPPRLLTSPAPGVQQNRPHILFVLWGESYIYHLTPPSVPTKCLC